MQERGIDGGMGAIIGLSEEQAEEVVEQAREHGEISVANINAPGQVVLSGCPARPRLALEMSKTVGAGAPSSSRSAWRATPLMRHARRVREGPGSHAVPRPVRAGGRQRHANMIRTADGLRDELTEHLVHGVQWVATVRNMAAIGVTDFVEASPAACLTGLVKRISPESNAHALDEADDGWLPEPAPPAPKRAKRKP